MAEIITKAGVVAEAPKAWERQYRGYSGTQAYEKGVITQKLLSLPEGFTAHQVDTIIGNTSWTSLKCDECGAEVDGVARFGDEDTHDHVIDVCEVCIRKAGIAIRAARKAGA